MPGRKQCAGTNAQGEPCGSPFVGDDGFCDAHRAGGISEMRRRAIRGALASRASKGLDASDLPPLEDPRSAETWLEAIGRAVATGRLGKGEADAATRAVRCWLQAHDAGRTRDRLEELAEAVETLRGPKAS